MPPTTTPYTHRNLEDVDDLAPQFGLGDAQEARFAGASVDAERTGFGLHRLKPNAAPRFAHRHFEAEEVYVVIAGSGRIRLDDEWVELRRLDAVRVAPPVLRTFEAGPEGMEVLAFGAHHEGDGEVSFEWWEGQES